MEKYKPNFFIGIPTINRADLLIEALNNYVIHFPMTKIFIQDNGNQPELNQWIKKYNDIHIYEPKIIILRSHENQGVAESWNILLRAGFAEGYRQALILNDDIYLGRTELQVNAFINDKSGFGFKFPAKSNWCAFLISQETYEIVGDFDKEFFPAYYEDNDYFYRMKLLDIKMLASEFLDPVIYRNSMTLAKDRTLNSKFVDNQRRYVAKWGGMPMKETFTKPFNK